MSTSQALEELEPGDSEVLEHLAIADCLYVLGSNLGLEYSSLM